MNAVTRLGSAVLLLLIAAEGTAKAVGESVNGFPNWAEPLDRRDRRIGQAREADGPAIRDHRCEPRLQHQVKTRGAHDIDPAADPGSSLRAARAARAARGRRVRRARVPHFVSSRRRRSRSTAPSRDGSPPKKHGSR
jgi:hypothetical protein